MLFRTNGPWGAGEGHNLAPAEVDTNFYELDQRVADVEADPPTPISVDHVTATETTFSIVLTDASVQGPFNLPFPKFTLLGEWQPLTLYNVPGTFITEGGVSYLIQFPHTSAATFDPGANDGAGHNFYGLLPFPTAPIIEFLPDGWQPLVPMGAYKLFSIPDVGLFLSLHAHTTAATFDQLALDGNGDPLYQLVFESIETNIAHLQAQFPGAMPGDGGTIFVFIQDQRRSLAFDPGFVDCSAHMEIMVDDFMELTIETDGNVIGTIEFDIDVNPDGEGGQFGTFFGDGTGINPISFGSLLRVRGAGGSPDPSARHLTVSFLGRYEQPTS